LLATTAGPLKLSNPVMTASGTSGSGAEMESFFDLAVPGALVLKTITLNARAGNRPPRLAETSSGLLNSIGLPNRGVRQFVKETLPKVRGRASCLVVNFAGEKEGEFPEAAAILEEQEGIDALEINLSCPNVEGGRIPFANLPGTVKRIVASVRSATGLPLIAKLSPNVTDIVSLAEAALEGGGDAVSVANTLLGMSVDWRTRKPRLSTGYGGLSGPCIKPVTLRMVHQVWNTLRCPIIGVGGIMTADDVMDYIVCGASAVQVGTATLADPTAIETIIRDLGDLLKREGIARIGDCVGTVDF